MLASRQPKKALEFLGRLLRDGEEPLPIAWSDDVDVSQADRGE